MRSKVSIITVVYNDVRNIEKSIQNTLSQTYHPLELIVVDGASTDGTVDVIKKYDKYIKWISEPDKGIYDAMNKGCQMATGDWVLFHNCGDFFISKDSVKDFFSNVSDSDEATFLIGDIFLFNEYGYKENRPNILNGTIFEGMPVNHPATFNRTTWQKKHPFNIGFRNSGDYDFYVKSFLEGATYKYINIKLVLMDQRSGATVDNRQLRLKENMKILIDYNAPIRLVNILRKQIIFQSIIDALLKIVPFLSIISKYRRKFNYSKNGWIKADIYNLLDNI